MAFTLYHATTTQAALSIDQSRKFLPGKHGFAGPGIYFAASEKNAVKHSFNGNPYKRPTVVIACKVELGKCLAARKNTVNSAQCSAAACNSVRISKTDTYAVYDPARISIVGFRSVTGDKATTWQPSMRSSRPEHVPAAGDDPNNELQNNGTSPIVVSALALLLSAIEASSCRALNTSRDMRALYLEHPSLRAALTESGGLQRFCDAHSELKRKGKLLLLSSRASTSGSGLETSPSPREPDSKTLAISLMDSLSLLPSDSDPSGSELESELAASESESCTPRWHQESESSPSEYRSSTSGSDFGNEASTAELGSSTSVSDFECDSSPSECESSTSGPDAEDEASPSGTESFTSGQALENQSFPAQCAFETLVASIQTSPTKSLNACTDVIELCMVHPWLCDAVNEAGGLQGLCEAHPELKRDGELLLLQFSDSALPPWLRQRKCAAKRQREQTEQLVQLRQVEINQAKMNALWLSQMRKLRMNTMPECQQSQA